MLSEGGEELPGSQWWMVMGWAADLDMETLENKAGGKGNYQPEHVLKMGQMGQKISVFAKRTGEVIENKGSGSKNEPKRT